MKVQTSVRAGAHEWTNRCESVRTRRHLRVRTGVRAGARKLSNRCESVRALRVRTGVRAGGVGWGGNRCDSVRRR